MVHKKLLQRLESSSMAVSAALVTQLSRHFLQTTLAITPMSNAITMITSTAKENTNAATTFAERTTAVVIVAVDKALKFVFVFNVR